MKNTSLDLLLAFQPSPPLPMHWIIQISIGLVPIETGPFEKQSLGLSRDTAKSMVIRFPVKS
jgi:hypothetical protein